MSEKISPLEAVFAAFFGGEPRTFPIEDGQRIEPGEIAKRIRGELDQLSANVVKNEHFETLFDKAKDSLEEAKAATEYQDQKVARLLTVVAFLTAAAGTIFGKFSDRFPIFGGMPGDRYPVFVFLAYVLFFVFALLVASGALVSFYATRTRFVWDASTPNVVKRDASPRSLLFFQESIRSSPEQWAKSFARLQSNADDLLLEYYKNYIIESYLINAKVADKIRLLEPAQIWLWNAIRVLLLWVALVFALYVAAPSVKSSDASPTSPVSVPAPSQSPGPDKDSPSLHLKQEGNPNIVVNCGGSSSQSTRSSIPKPPVCAASCATAENEKSACK